MAPERDHYQVLGLEPGADPDEIRRAHRRLAHVLHPDRHLEAGDAERALADRRMREINEAWNVLRDPLRRSTYDAERSLQTGSGAVNGRSSTVPRATSGRPPGARRTSTSWTGPGESSDAGRGAYWVSNGGSRSPGERHSGASGWPDHEEDPEDGIPVAPATAFLLGKGPIIVVVAVLVGLFVVTAYVGAGGGGEPQVRPLPGDMCARVISGSRAILVPCNAANDGEILAEVDAALECPAEAPRYVKVDTRFFCIPGEADAPDESSGQPSGRSSGDD